MYLVKTRNGLHSQWNTENEAENQARVLKEHGYRDIDVEFVNCECSENGYYYV